VPERALILVDLQNDFVPGGALAVKEGDTAVPIANRMQDKFELVVASKDWHPRDHASFAVNHPGTKVGDVIDLDGLQQVLWPVHCVQNTHGAEFVPSLRTDKIARIFFKGIDAHIDSYSAIYDNGHRRSTGLAEYLREQGVRSIFLLGLATDYCVKFTALDALAEGFRVHVIEDGCRGVNLKPDDSKDAILEMTRAGVSMVQSAMLSDAKP
jgi:nicotinamidase/pyrazinamidase